MTFAAHETTQRDSFTVNGRSYRWHEGEHALTPHARRLESRRDELGAALSRAVVPSLTRRGARRQVMGAGPRGGVGRAHWVVWRAPGDAHPVWALYVPTRRLAASALADVGRPANDGALLAAWGDGPVMAWASERPELREAVREALRSLPEFLSAGVASADVTMPVRVVCG